MKNEVKNYSPGLFSHVYSESFYDYVIKQLRAIGKNPVKSRNGVYYEYQYQYGKTIKRETGNVHFFNEEGKEIAYTSGTFKKLFVLENPREWDKELVDETRSFDVFLAEDLKVQLFLK